MRKSIAFLILTVFLLASACSGEPLNSGQWIAFESSRDGNLEVYKMGADGSQLTRLTHDPAPDTDPSWSPDGNWIVFVSERDAWPREKAPAFNNTEIYKMRADGSQVTRLTHDPAVDTDPCWSPDGNWILFDSLRDVPTDTVGIWTWDIYKVRADGSQLTRLTDNPGSDFAPQFSPDANWIAFVRCGYPRGGPHPCDIYKMRANGSEVTRLTQAAGAFNPDWSPDGNWIAFACNHDGNYEIYKVRPDGSEGTKLTNNPAGDSLPSWSPDGNWIAFLSDRDGNDEIYNMKADGTHITNLTDNAARDYTHSWSADGNWIVFVSERAGQRNSIAILGTTKIYNTEIHTMRADGSQVTRLTHNPSNRLRDFMYYLGGDGNSQDEQPAWGP